MAAGTKIWVVEDDPGCLFTYREILANSYDVIYTESLQDFKNLITDPKFIRPQLIVAEMKLKDGSFTEYLAEIPPAHLVTIPMLIVSSLDDVGTLNYCFELGALDYLVKPINKNEFLVKVERLVKCPIVLVSSVTRKVQFDLGRLYAGLTVKEQQILKHFLSKENYETCRQAVLRDVWPHQTGQTKVFDVHLHNLRRKILLEGFEIKSIGRSRWRLIRSSGFLSPFLLPKA